ncbi:MAG: replicative helicase [Planctomycetota bacterium]|jgi:replicative DNA helicase
MPPDAKERRSRAPRERVELDRGAIARLADALPPQAPEVEAALLGALLHDPRLTGDVLQVVRSAEEFVRPAHRTIYSHMCELYERSAAFDIVQLQQLLRDRGVFDEVGGLDYLVSLAESVPSATNALEFAREIRDKATLRELIDAAGTTLHEAHSNAEDAQGVLELAEARIFAIGQRRESTHASDLATLLNEAIERIQAHDGSATTGVATGYDDLDQMTSGLQRGEMVILAARPSMGKTAFALNVMQNVALAGQPVAFFSLEMSRQQLVQRMLCSQAGIDSQRLRRGTLRAEDYDRVLAACDELRQAQVYIDDSPGLSLMALRSKARRMAERFGIQAIFVDYLQLMSSGTRVESRQTEVSEISRGLKATARELNVPVFCLSQLNRAAEQREGHRPRMSDLRESGSIEQDADVIMMLHREEYYHLQDPDWAASNPDRVGIAELIIAKQRNGPTGTVNLVWDGKSTAFRPWSPATPPGVPVRVFEPRPIDDLPV